MTLANNRETVSIPVGTVIDVALSDGPWDLPVSSDQHTLPRISASSSCGSVRASFPVRGNGWIRANTHVAPGLGMPDITLSLNVVTHALPRQRPRA